MLKEGTRAELESSSRVPATLLQAARAIGELYPLVNTYYILSHKI